MIKAIAFDVGGVITSTDFDALYASFAQSIGLSFKAFDSIYQSNFVDMLTGKLSLEDLWTKLKNAGGKENVNYTETWLREASKVRSVNHELIAYIDILRKNYKVGIISDLTPTRYLLDTEIDLYSHFDFIVLSFQEKCRKPDPKIYELGLKRAGVKPEEMIFIDDKEALAQGAEKVGIKTILYKDNHQLFSELDSNLS